MIVELLTATATIGLISYVIPIVADTCQDVFEILTTKDLGLEEYEENLDV